jgi:hypothetical protein
VSGRWTTFDLAPFPHAVRPETHWLHDVIRDGDRYGRPLWFSLQLSRALAKQLYEAFSSSKPPGEGPFDKLVAKGVRMAPASHAALGLVLRANICRDSIGTDLLVPSSAFKALCALVGKGIEIADAGLAVDGSYQDNTAPVIGAEPAATESTIPDDAVIVAIIDDGLGIANHRFRSSLDSTRIAHFLDLGLPWAEAPIGPQPTDELLGRSWTGPQIDELLATYLDEQDIYHAMALVDPRSERRQPLRAAVSHGTHMLDTACGYDYVQTDHATLARRPIIAVQLPTEVAEDRSDAWMPQSAKRALDWILVKAAALSAARPNGSHRRRLPLIVNGSCGSMAGPQDGWSDVERRVSQFVETYRDGGDPRLCTVVLSAGNSLQLRATALLRRRSAMVTPLPWRVLPDDKTSSFLQIWLPEADDTTPQQVRVTLTPPRDAPAQPGFSELGKAAQWEIDGIPYARIYHQRSARPKGRSRECITIAIRPTEDDGIPVPIEPRGECGAKIRPTEDDGVPVPVAPSGEWGVKIEALHLAETAEIDLHIHRDDAGLFARGKGRQSYFDQQDYEQFDPISGRANSDERVSTKSPVILKRTLSAYACGDATLVVGGYRHSDGEPAPYSSSGPTRSVRVGPDLATVTEESPALPGILGTGTTSGSVAILNGTSVAAPLVTRRLADIIAAGGSVDTLRDEVRTFEKNAPSGPHGPYRAEPRPLRLGLGRLPFAPTPPYRTRIDELSCASVDGISPSDRISDTSDVV